MGLHDMDIGMIRTPINAAETFKDGGLNSYLWQLN